MKQFICIKFGRAPLTNSFSLHVRKPDLNIQKLFLIFTHQVPKTDFYYLLTKPDVYSFEVACKSYV